MCPFYNLCTSINTDTPYFPLQVLLIVSGIIAGYCLARFPQQAIDFQARCYRWFNWILEPISMEKEIRHMRLFGKALIIFSVLAGVYVMISAQQ